LAAIGCASSNDQKNNEEKALASIESKVEKETNESILTDADSIEIPSFEIEVSLTDDAELKIRELNESIIVYAIFSGIPVDTASEEFIEWEELTIATKKIELTDSRVAYFSGIKLSKAEWNSIKEKNFEVLINVYTGRRTSPNNLITCDLLQDNIDNIKGRRFKLEGKLIY